MRKIIKNKNKKRSCGTGRIFSFTRKALIGIVFLLSGQVHAQTSTSNQETITEIEKTNQKADSLYATGHFDESIPLYRELIRRNPEKFEFYEPLAYSYAKLGLFNEAKEWLSERQKYSDDEIMSQCFLADLAVRSGDYKAVLRHTEKMITISDTHTPWAVSFCIAEMEVHLGEYKRARERMERAIALLRQQDRPLHGLSFLAFLALREGDDDIGKALLKEHQILVMEKLSQNEDPAATHFDLATIEALQGNRTAAVSHLKEALRRGGSGQYWGGYYYLKTDPIFKSLHEHPEFEQYMEEIKKGVDRMRKNVKGLKEESEYVVDIIAADYAFGMPSEIPSGWVTFRMENIGEKVHYAIIMQSTSDLSIEEIRAELGSGEFFPMSYAGGPGLHSPGHKSDVTVNLEPGNYVMICEIMTEDGKKHSELGMQAAFQVTEKPSGATKPKADTRIILDKYDIRRTKAFAAGKQTVEIVHKGFPNGLHLFRVQDSLSIEKAERQMDGELGDKQVQWLTGAEPIDSVGSTFITYNFSPGEYQWTSYAYVWGVKDGFTIEEGERLNKLLEREEKSKSNRIGIKVEDKEIQINNNIQAGRNTFYYINQESDTHLIQIDMLKEGKSKKSILDFYELAPEDRNDNSLMWWRGWYILLNEGDSATVKVQPGNYVIYCSEKSGNGEKHYNQGEITEFVVE